MIAFNDPYIASVLQGMVPDDVGKVALSQTARPLLSIFTGDIGSPFDTVELDRESRRFIKVRANNVKKTYDEAGVENKTSTFFDVV